MFQLENQNKTFYYFLAGIFMIHGMFMVIKFKDQFTEIAVPQEAIKIKLVQEAIKDLSAQKKRQIVQSEDSAANEKPKTEAFLSDKDRSFDRQTVARNIDTFKQAALGNSTVTQEASKQKTAKKKKDALKNLKLSDFSIDAGEPIPKEISRSPASQSIKGVKNGDPTSQGMSATNDYVEEMTLGDFTHLNTVEYKYYGFFHRIRQKLEQFWGKSIREKADNLFRSGRRLPASENLITSLRITLNEQGEIIGVKILGTSGVKELDDAAIESFNQAGPFPNPPKDLLVNGKATIEWGFVVKS